MDFATAPGGNPFLMSDDDYAMTSDNSMASNPFLAEDFSMPPADPALNPFLMGGDDFQAPAAEGTAGLNPFAMFGVEEDPQPPPVAAQEATVDFFGGAVPQPEYFAPQQPPIQDTLIFSPEKPPPPRPAAPPPMVPVPTSLPLAGVMEYHPDPPQVITTEEVAPVPSRPPPPRPVPPSRETVQLIQSVTGAMEANSSDLLDRLQANRTPSPTPIRDLHSPSPTPDMFSEGPDLLMDTTQAPPPSSETIEPPQTAANFMDIFGGGQDEPAPVIEEPPPPPQFIEQMPPQIIQEHPQQMVNKPSPPQPVPPPTEQLSQPVQPPQPVQPQQQTADLFGLFSDAAAPDIPPTRPTPSLVTMTLTPPEDANLIGDLSSPGNATQPQSTETPIAFAAEPRRPPPPKVPPRPPSPAAPLPPSAFPETTFSETPKPPTVLTPPEQLQTFHQEATTEEPDEFDSFNDAFSAKFESAGNDKKSGDAFYNAFGATVCKEDAGDGGELNIRMI